MTKSVTFTGHRYIPQSKRSDLCTKLEKAIKENHTKGVRNFLCGMAVSIGDSCFAYGNEITISSIFVQIIVLFQIFLMSQLSSLEETISYMLKLYLFQVRTDYSFSYKIFPH